MEAAAAAEGAEWATANTSPSRAKRCHSLNIFENNTTHNNATHANHHTSHTSAPTLTPARIIAVKWGRGMQDTLRPTIKDEVTAVIHQQSIVGYDFGQVILHVSGCGVIVLCGDYECRTVNV